MKNNNINILINEYQQGNEKVFNEIFKTEENLLKRIIKTFLSHIEYDDAFQTASLGLLKALKTFDTNKGIEFSTYLYNVVRNELIMELRHVNNIEKIETISTETNTTDDLTVIELLISNDNVEEEIMEQYEHEYLYEMIEKYAKNNQMKKEVIYMILQGKKQREIAEVVGISRGYVSKMYKDFIAYGQRITA